MFCDGNILYSFLPQPCGDTHTRCPPVYHRSYTHAQAAGWGSCRYTACAPSCRPARCSGLIQTISSLYDYNNIITLYSFFGSNS